MIHVDLTPLQRIRADKEAIIRFYRLNSEHFSNPDELAEDTPLFYYDNSGEWTLNLDFQNQLRHTQRELLDSQAVKEAMLIVKVSEGYNPNQLANRVVECLQARLEHIHRLSVELIDAVPDDSGTYQMKAQIFKHFALRDISAVSSAATDKRGFTIYVHEAGPQRRFFTRIPQRLLKFCASVPCRLHVV